MKKGMTHSTAPAHCNNKRQKKKKKGARCVRKLTDAICFGLCASSSCNGFVGRGLGVCVCEQGVCVKSSGGSASKQQYLCARVWQKFGLIVTAGSVSVGDSGPPCTKMNKNHPALSEQHSCFDAISRSKQLIQHYSSSNHAFITRSSIAVQVSQSKQTTDWTSTSRS